MKNPTAWTADVPDAFLSVWPEGSRWRWRYRDAAGRLRRTLTRNTPQGARSAAAREYKGRVGRTAAQTVSWTPCTLAEAQAHGNAEASQAAARRASADVATCVRAQRPESAPVERRPTGSPGARTVVDFERPAVPLDHFLRLLCGAVPAEDPAYLAFVHTVPSVVSGQTCEIAHHEPPKGMGGANDCDYNATPLTARESDIRHGVVHPKPGEPTAEEIERVCLAARLPLVLAYFTGQRGPGRKRR